MDCRGVVLQLSFIGLPCVPLSGYSCLSLSSYTTGCTTSGRQSAKNRQFTAFYYFTPATGTTGTGSYRPFS